MARLTHENAQRATELMALYPHPRSALIPILHVAQEQDGWLSPEAVEHVAELLGITAAEVYGTASFYDMLFTEPIGRHLVSICTNIACLLNGAYELLEHAEARLRVKPGGTTPDGEFTLEEVECLALCGQAPCLAVNWRFLGNVSHADFDQLVTSLQSGTLASTVPPHGTLSRVRRAVGLRAAAPPEGEVARVQGTEPVGEDGSGPVLDRPAADKRDRGEAQPAGSGSVDESAKQGRDVQHPPGTDTGTGKQGR